MSVQDKVSALEGLLDRVRRNAAKPRAAAAAPPSAEPAPPRQAAPPPQVAPPPQELELSGGGDVDDLLDAPPISSGPRSDMETMVANPEEEAALAADDGAGDDIIDMDIDDFGEEVDVEIDVESPAAEAADVEVSIDFDDDEPPASSKRPIVDEAADLAEREVPLKTPPPESGRQVAVAPISEAAVPSIEQLGATVQLESDGSGVDDLLEADLNATPGQVDGPRPQMPTMEQLGETIELRGSDAPDAHLELDAPEDEIGEDAPDELEAAIPSGAGGGVYDDSLAPPPEAKEELQRHLQTERSASGAPAAGPEVTSRPAIDIDPTEFTVSTTDDDSSFLAALEASLSL